MFTSKEILELLNGGNDEWLFNKANRIKQENYGNVVFLRGIIENSNYCENDCFYCGLRSSNQTYRYRLDRETMLNAAQTIIECDINSIVLQAGQETNQKNIEFLDDIIPAIKSLTGADITLSHGDFPDEVYAKWKELGADRYLIKMETLNPELHAKIRPPHNTVEKRLDRVKSLINLGYQVGSGFIAGMPGYTTEMMAEEILELSKIGIHMFSLSPFLSSKNTPWADEPNCGADIIYRTCAVYRILDPLVNIPITNALNVLDGPNARAKGFARGCNVVMHSFTPQEVRKNYEIYPGKGTVGDECLSALNKIKQNIADLGLIINPNERGRSKKS